MKKAKILKIVSSIFVSAALAAATAISSFAYDLTITGTKTGHTYGAYQIFKGDLDGTTLSNIKWGDGVNTTGLITALKADETLSSLFTSLDADTAEAADVAKAIENATAAQTDAFAQVIGQKLGTASKTVTSSDPNTVISELPAGYYLIKDTAAVSGHDAATKFIIRIVKNTEAQPKTGVPTVEKKLQDNDDGVADQWQDVADYCVGESVPFKLTGTMPSNIADYKTYNYVFHDTLSEGLTFNNDVVVKIGETTIDASKYTVTASGTNIDIAFTNIKSCGVDVSASSVVTVEYSAKVNEKAVVGLPGNPNDVYLEFSNNPNQGGEGDKGETPHDKVVVFTYKLDVTKIDGEAEARTTLEGAQFKLSHGDKWLVIYTEGENKGKIKEWTTDESKASTLESDANGKIAIIGLDEGNYSLKETKAPNGYNLLQNPIALTITANDIHTVDYTGENAADLLKKVDDIEAIQLTVDSGTPVAGTVGVGQADVATDVANNKGSVLPETGGIGTTIFFVGGGIIVAAAAILLIAKMRKKTEA